MLSSVTEVRSQVTREAPRGVESPWGRESPQEPCIQARAEDTNHDGLTALALALRLDCVSCGEALLLGGSDPNRLPRAEGPSRSTLLMTAAQLGAQLVDG